MYIIDRPTFLGPSSVNCYGSLFATNHNMATSIKLQRPLLPLQGPRGPNDREPRGGWSFVHRSYGETLSTSKEILVAAIIFLMGLFHGRSPHFLTIKHAWIKYLFILYWRWQLSSEGIRKDNEMMSFYISDWL
jgi:hypothetical protein